MSHRRTGNDTIREALWTPALLRVLGAAAMWGFAHACFVLLPKYLALELGVGPKEIGRTMGAFGLASVPVAAIAGLLVDHRPTRTALAAGSVLLALSALGFAASHGFGPHIYFLRAVQALANALVVTAVGVAVTEIAPISRLSQAIGLTGATMLAMNAVAPMAMEPLAEAAGWTAVFFVSAAVALASLVLAAGIRDTRPRRNGSEHSPGVDGLDVGDGSSLRILRRVGSVGCRLRHGDGVSAATLARCRSCRRQRISLRLRRRCARPPVAGGVTARSHRQATRGHVRARRRTRSAPWRSAWCRRRS